MALEERQSNFNLIKLLISVGSLIFALNCLHGTFADFDLWGYLGFGRLFWEGKGFPYKDIFSYAPTRDLWVYHEWLTGVLFFPVYKATGAAGLQVLKYALALLTLFIAYLTSRKRGSDFVSFAVTLLLSLKIFSYGYGPVRAQVFTYLFFALTVYLLERARKSNQYKCLLWLLPVQLLWCNLHGGFVAGIAIIGVYSFGEALSKKKFLPYLGIMGLSLAVTLVNPYGVDYWLYIKDAILMPRPNIEEWCSLFYCLKNGLYLEHAILFSVSASICLAVFVWYKKREVTPFLMLAITAYLGVSHIRHVVFFAISFMIFMPLIFTDFCAKLIKSHNVGHGLRRIKIVFIIFLSLIFADASVSFFKKLISDNPLSLRTASVEDAGVLRSYYPTGAVEYIKHNGFRGNLLPLFEWGEYIAWSLSPGCLVGMDGRYETVYTETYSEEYFEFIYGRKKWRNFLTKYPHEMILIKTRSKLNLLLQKEPGWMKVYQDKGSVLYIKKGHPEV